MTVFLCLLLIRERLKPMGRNEVRTVDPSQGSAYTRSRARTTTAASPFFVVASSQQIFIPAYEVQSMHPVRISEYSYREAFVCQCHQVDTGKHRNTCNPQTQRPQSTPFKGLLQGRYHRCGALLDSFEIQIRLDVLVGD